MEKKAQEETMWNTAQNHIFGQIMVKSLKFEYFLVWIY